jgi:hypothetical protein
MNEIPKDNVGQPPQKKGFWRRQFSWQGLRRAVTGLVVVITLIALMVTEENWRGKHDWENYRRDLEAKGEHLDWQAFVPPTVPDDQNLFASPVFKKILDNKISFSPYPKNDKNYPIDLGYWAKNTITDFKPWQRAYRDLGVDDNGVAFPVPAQPRTPVADVLFALGRFDETVEELSEASRRPYAIIPLPYKDGIIATAGTIVPYLAALKRCAQILNVRAIAELADNQNQKALDEIELLFHLNNSLNNSPLLISQLVQMAIMNIEIQPIWEGLAGHKWSDQQLAELETELSKMDFLADYELSIRCERALEIDSLESQRQTHEIILPTEDGNSMTVHTIMMPSAYFYQNELSFAQISEQWTLPLVDTNSHVISPTHWRQVDAALRAQQKHLSLYTYQSRMIAPAFASIVKKIAFDQSIVDLARVGCALERYRLAHGKYPESLDALEPQFIAQVPHDIIDGQPLHYRLEPNGQFALYSVGWNETDDGGQVVLTKSGKVDRDKGDWVWQYPQKN